MAADFREVQQFHQPWLRRLLLLNALVFTIYFGAGMVQQLALGRPWGTRPMSDGGLLLTGTGLIALVWAIAWLFRVMRLTAEVRTDGIHLDFFPLTRRTIPFAAIVTCEVRRYRPLQDYGGWGLRFGFKGRAYSVSGGRGVQLTLSHGRPVLIGSQRPEKLAAAIRRRLAAGAPT